MQENKTFPLDKVPLGKEPFHFSCHAGVSCFMSCCKNVDMFLYPYDIIRLKKCLQCDAESFMRQFTRLVSGDQPYFPAVMLKLNDDPEKSCPFLGQEGCSVYADRPSACRTYPLERAVDRSSWRGRGKDYYFLTAHSYCLGHNEPEKVTVTQWIRDQKLHDYNSLNDAWAELDTLFATNPWKGEGSGGPKQQMAFMACYDIDGFRRLVIRERIFERFRFKKSQIEKLRNDDTVFLQFSFEWVKFFLTGTSSLPLR
jgi:Fe-S-cluster containining protein